MNSGGKSRTGAVAEKHGGSRPSLIAVGRLGKTHGVNGEIRLYPFFPRAIASLSGSEVYSVPEKHNSSPSPLHLVSTRGSGDWVLLKFEGIDSPEEAQNLSNTMLKAKRSSLPPLPKGQYYFEEIIGLPVFDTAGNKLGVLTDFFEAGERDVWEIKDENGAETLVPCIKEVVKEVDIAKGVIIIEPMESVE